MKSFTAKRLLDLDSAAAEHCAHAERRKQIFVSVLSTGKENTVAALMCAKLLEAEKETKNMTL